MATKRWQKAPETEKTEVPAEEVNPLAEDLRRQLTEKQTQLSAAMNEIQRLERRVADLEQRVVAATTREVTSVDLVHAWVRYVAAHQPPAIGPNPYAR